MDPFEAVAVAIGQGREGADERAREVQRRRRRPETRETVGNSKGCRVKGFYGGAKRSRSTYCRQRREGPFRSAKLFGSGHSACVVHMTVRHIVQGKILHRSSYALDAGSVLLEQVGSMGPRVQGARLLVVDPYGVRVLLPRPWGGEMAGRRDDSPM